MTGSSSESAVFQQGDPRERTMVGSIIFCQSTTATKHLQHFHRELPRDVSWNNICRRERFSCEGDRGIPFVLGN